jgi:hypothetical protein
MPEHDELVGDGDDADRTPPPVEPVPGAEPVRGRWERPVDPYAGTEQPGG